MKTSRITKESFIAKVFMEEQLLSCGCGYNIIHCKLENPDESLIRAASGRNLTSRTIILTICTPSLAPASLNHHGFNPNFCKAAASTAYPVLLAVPAHEGKMRSAPTLRSLRSDRCL